jgi:hypothetical protein
MVHFSNQKSQFGYISGGLELENIDIFYSYLDYFTAILHVYFTAFWSLGIFTPFWYIAPRKNLATLGVVRKSTLNFSQAKLAKTKERCLSPQDDHAGGRSYKTKAFFSSLSPWFCVNNHISEDYTHIRCIALSH